MIVVMTRREYGERKVERFWTPKKIWVFVVIFILSVLCGSLLYRQQTISRVSSHLRSNIVVGTRNGELSLLSYDPSEGKILQLLFDDIEISSRSVGQYKLSQLYGLGAYKNMGFEFAKQKMQGFLRLPIVSYLEVGHINKWEVRKALLVHIWDGSKSGISRLDAIRLLTWSLFMEWHTIDFDNLIREGVVETKSDEKYQVNDDRLQQFVGQRLFDWQVGAEGMTVALINESGKEGLGSDVAKFLVNVGMDVVAVRTGTNDVRETTEIVTHSSDQKSATHSVLKAIFGNEKVRVEDKFNFDEYRSGIVIFIGSDMQEMF